MMRSGLDKPGALPLLALVVFSLLTLVPSLSSIYNIKLADFGYLTGGTRKLPLIKDGVAPFSPDTPPIDPQKSWVMTAQYRTRGNRLSRSSRSNGASTVPGEATPVENQSLLSYIPPESSSSFMFGRRARAFRTYFIQQLDDYQLFTSFSNRSFPAAPTILKPLVTPSNDSPLPTSTDNNRSETSPHPHNNSRSDTSCREEMGLRIPALCNKWQQACHKAMGLWEHVKQSASNSRVQPLIQLGSKYLESKIKLLDGEQSSTSGCPPKDASTATNSSPGLKVQTQNPRTTSSDQTTDTAGHTAELRGSCMAVVIGLVAGIVWF